MARQREKSIQISSLKRHYTMSDNKIIHDAILVLPHLRVQSANAISSPLTWGFPAITAFTGLMTALERKLGPEAGLRFSGIGVICHHFEAQINENGYTQSFRLTRNPVLATGETAAIVEEGRIHLDITLVFSAKICRNLFDEEKRQELARHISDILSCMRIAGGSVISTPTEKATSARRKPCLELLQDTDEDRKEQFRQLARRWLPGFALVCRDDLLQNHLRDLQIKEPGINPIDAWLDFARWTHRAVEHPAQPETLEKHSLVKWITEPRSGWLVPIPVGFSALSELQPAGSIANARDMTTPVRFVEPVWSVGQWISPHRLKTLNDLVWFPEKPSDKPHDNGVYRCSNEYTPTPHLQL
jgi:CRISPR-associated protein Csy2